MSELLKQINPKKIELLLFELDGTLCEDQVHFDFYAECLADGLKTENQKFFWRDLNLARKGEHILALGRVYDRVKDLVLQIDRRSFVKRALSWDGKPLEQDQVKALYPETANCNMKNMFYLGDGWWLPLACSYHYGLKDPGKCYQKTKNWLVQNKHALQPIPGLEEKLKILKDHYPLVLDINSEREDTERLLGILGLRNIFSAIYTCCEKPEKTKILVKRVENDFQIYRARILSIGDNFQNEIALLRIWGAQTVLIDPHGFFQEDRGVGPVVESIKEIFPLFNLLISIS